MDAHQSKHVIHFNHVIHLQCLSQFAFLAAFLAA